jgi:hypothetical protein
VVGRYLSVRLRCVFILASSLLVGPFYCATNARAQVTVFDTLIASGSTWKYLDRGIDPGSSWRELNWVDADWSSGPAKLGYGDGDESTVVNCGPSSPTCNSGNFSSTYFRHEFLVADASRYGSLNLRLRRDDGAVVYLNGNQVLSSNMPDVFAHQTWALATVGGADETAFLTYSLSPGSLLTGRNLLAVEIHQSSSTSSDIGFDLELRGVVGTTAPNLSRGPYLQQVTPNGVSVRWQSDTSSQSKVCYATAPDALSTCVQDTVAAMDHQVEVKGLASNTRYYYSIGSEAFTLAGQDESFTFKTAPAAGLGSNTRIWVLGDSGTANSDARAVRDGYLSFAGSSKADFCVMLGDNAYSTGTDPEYQRAVFDTYPQILRQCPLWSVIGNHDGYSADSAGQSGPYFDIFNLPKNAEAGGLASGTEAYYSFDYGQIHLIALDSNGSDRGIDSPMAIWLRQDLQQTNAKWIIVFWHHPPYTKGSHNSDSQTDSEGRMVQMRENILPILENFGVDLVLSGHSHAYERSFLINGHYGYSQSFNAAVHAIDRGSGQQSQGGAYRKPAAIKVPHSGSVYVVAGSSGQASGGSLNHPAMLVSLNVLGSLVVDLVGNRLEVTFVDSTGSARDTFAISKEVGTYPAAPPPPSAVAGDRQALVSFAAPADDGGTAITGYTVTSSPGGFISNGCTYSPCIVTGLTNGTAYTFTVAASNWAGVGAVSDASERVVPKFSQTINFDVALSLTVGSNSTVNGSCTSGLTVIYSTTTPSICTIVGSVVMGVSVGTCTIAANQSGNTSYAVAAQVTQNITVFPFNQITHYYTNILNRVADDGGKAFWQSEVSRMSNLSVSPNEAYIALALNFFTSAEFLARGFGDEQFVRNLYLTFYNREADQGGLDYWRGLLSSGLPRDMIMYAFMFSTEFGNFMIQNIGATYQRPEVGAVIDYYRGAFGRLPDDGGLKYWVNQFRTAQCSGNPTAGVYTAATSIAAAFFGSAEYNNAAPSANKYISDLFNAFMRRSADLEGYNFWVSQVATGAQSKDAVRQQFVDSPEFAARVQAIAGAACTGMMQ